jgi:hypothetical protein
MLSVDLTVLDKVHYHHWMNHVHSAFQSGIQQFCFQSYIPSSNLELVVNNEFSICKVPIKHVVNKNNLNR